MLSSVLDWVLEDHLVWTILGAVEKLDLRAFYAVEGLGERRPVGLQGAICCRCLNLAPSVIPPALPASAAALTADPPGTATAAFTGAQITTSASRPSSRLPNNVGQCVTPYHMCRAGGRLQTRRARAERQPGAHLRR
jgi:hypothetical protein